MNKRKIILGYLFGFLALISLFLLSLSLICKYTISNKDYMYHIIKSNNYYEKIYNEIGEELELKLLSTGFNKDILKDIYTKEEVISDINLFIDNLYAGKLTVLDKSEMRYKVKMNIDGFFKETKLTVVNKDDLNNFVDDLVDVYKNEICLYNYVDSIIPQFNKINNIINIGFIILLVLFIILAIILISVIKITYFGSIFISCGLVILFIRLFVFERIDVENILIITEEFSVILRIILKYLQSIMFYFSIGTIILGIIILLFTAKCKVKKIKMQ